jgi:hypothetical protein
MVINENGWIRREPGGTRTPNLLIRSQMLYPIKLQVQSGAKIQLFLILYP